MQQVCEAAAGIDAEDGDRQSKQSAGVPSEDVNRLGSKYHRIELINLKRDRNTRNGQVTETNPF